MTEDKDIKIIPSPNDDLLQTNEANTGTAAALLTPEMIRSAREECTDLAPSHPDSTLEGAAHPPEELSDLLKRVWQCMQNAQSSGGSYVIDDTTWLYYNWGPPNRGPEWLARQQDHIGYLRGRTEMAAELAREAIGTRSDKPAPRYDEVLFEGVAAFSDEDACYVARVPEFPNLAAHGDTAEGALAQAQAAAASMADVRSKSPSLESILRGALDAHDREVDAAFERGLEAGKELELELDEERFEQWMTTGLDPWTIAVVCGIYDMAFAIQAWEAGRKRRDEDAAYERAMAGMGCKDINGRDG